MLAEARRRFGPRGFPVPVLLGVLPLVSARHAEFLHNEVPGITIPDAARTRMPRRASAGTEAGIEMADALLAAVERESRGTYLMPSFGRYEQAAELVRRIRARHPAVRPPDRARATAHRPGAGLRIGHACERPSVTPGSPVARRWPSRSSSGSPSCCRCSRRSPRPARRSPTRSSTRRSTTTAEVLRRGHDPAARADDRRDRERTGAEVVVYTQLVAVAAVTTEEAEAHAIALMDQWGVGRAGLRRRARDPVRPPRGRPVPRPGPAVRRARLPRDVPLQRGAPADLRRGHAPAPPRLRPRRRRCSWRWPRSTRTRRPSTPRRSRSSASSTRVLGLIVAPLLVRPGRRLGDPDLVALRPRPVYLDDPSIHIPAPPPGLTPAAGAAVREGRSAAARSRRPASTSRPRPDRVPGRGEGRAAGLGVRPRPRSAIHTSDTVIADPKEPRSSRRRLRARAAAADGRGHELPRPAAQVDRRQRRLHRARRHPQVRHGRRRASTSASRSTSSGRAGSRRRPARRRAAGVGAACLLVHRRRSSPSSSAPTCRPSGHRARRRGARRRRASCCSSSPASMPARTMPTAR